MEGTPAVGAFGKRAATLEATGDWAAIGDDGSMEALTGAGLFGKALSVAPTLPRLMSLRYSGHVLRDGRKLTMEDFVPPTPETLRDARRAPHRDVDVGRQDDDGTHYRP